MSEQSKVQCQCCGKMMVPRVITTVGVQLGAIRVGEGVVSNVCPFCLSENWETGNRKSLFVSAFSSTLAWYLSMLVIMACTVALLGFITASIDDKAPKYIYLAILATGFIIGSTSAEYIKRKASMHK